MTYIFRCGRTGEPILITEDDEEARELYEYADDPITCEVWDGDKHVEDWPLKASPSDLH